MSDGLAFGLFQTDVGAATSYLPVPEGGTVCCTFDTVKVMKVMAAIRWSFPSPKGALWPLRHGKVYKVYSCNSAHNSSSREVKFTEVPSCHAAGRDR